MNDQSSPSKIFLSTKDYLVSNKDFDLVWNKEEDMLITSPIPPIDQLGQYYKSDSYISHTDSSKTFVDKIYQTVKRYSINRKLALVEKFLKEDKTLLDIGAGTGDFLQAAKSKGWQTAGVETNPDAIRRAAQKQIDLVHDVKLLGRQKFKAITLWHVLEHLPNPEEHLLEYHALLKESGLLVIAVPNFKSWDAKHYKNFWAAYDVPRHLFHFSKESIGRLAGDNFKVEAIHPMKFDSFYVSLLSERYKKSKAPLAKGFINGLRSNLAAMVTNEYSSQIYVLRKRQN